MKKACNPEWITYKARFDLDGQSVLGTGRTKKDGVASAARKFINNKYLAEKTLFCQVYLLIYVAEEEPVKSTRKFFHQKED